MKVDTQVLIEFEEYKEDKPKVQVLVNSEPVDALSLCVMLKSSDKRKVLLRKIERSYSKTNNSKYLSKRL